MGLDWTVMARHDGEMERCPTDVIGARRATWDDPEVVNELYDIWEDGEQQDAFDDYMAELLSRTPPPIAILFGSEARAAIPAVRAEEQYYGYRADALMPESNRVAAFAQAQGHDFSGMYHAIEGRAQFDARIAWLDAIVRDYTARHAAMGALAARYYRAFRDQDDAARDAVEAEFTDDDIDSHAFEIFVFLGAIDWLRFWSDKGFKVDAHF